MLCDIGMNGWVAEGPNIGSRSHHYFTVVYVGMDCEYYYTRSRRTTDNQRFGNRKGPRRGHIHVGFIQRIITVPR